MKKKRILAAGLFLFVLALVVSGMVEKRSHRIEHISCTEDYPEIYADALEEIFGEYSVGERRERHIEGESCSCGYHQDTVDYYIWEISYRDALGNSFLCELTNREDFYAQQYQWMEDQVFSHFYSTYALRFFPSAADDTYKGYCSVGDIHGSWSGEEELRQLETAEAYLQSLIDNETVVPLGSMDYNSVFSHYPVVLSIHIDLDDEDISKEQWQANFDENFERLGEMAEAVVRATHSSANLVLNLYSRSEAAPEWAYNRFAYYVSGAPVENRRNFDSKVHEAYTGKFWE